VANTKLAIHSDTLVGGVAQMLCFPMMALRWRQKQGQKTCNGATTGTGIYMYAL